MLIDLSRCIGCLSCEVACVQEKGLESPFIRPMRVLRLEGLNGSPEALYWPTNCYHCEPAPCVLACPTAAMRKGRDGVVFVEKERCIGCKACIVACPYGAITFNPETMKVEKCDYCRHRLEQDLLPSCVEKCTTNCLYFVRLDERPKERHLKGRLELKLFDELFS
ncbi:MAG: 4Fe-4S dicluster domain-containing protein [Aquificae bacterium]|nr:4Fe-4S dicluster domain-containing protein [Aquificota bacterium]